MLSVNTNPGQMIALQSYRATAQTLADIQNHVSTGLKTSSPKDNGAVYAIAQNMRSLANSYETLRQANDRHLSLLDVTISATQNISDLLVEMKKLALAATDPSLSTADRAAINDQFLALKQQIDSVASSATYNGQNLIDSNGSNFVQYGPGAMPPGTSPVEWGNTPRTTGEPKAGEPMTLRFGFSGSGQQPEMVSGDIDFKLRYFDNGTWTIVPLASTTIPTVPPTQVGPNLPPYVAEANATMPTLPGGATNVQIYAEYLGPVPAPDGAPVSELDSHGDPSASGTAKNVPQLMMSWTGRDWQSVPAQPPGYYATSNGTVSGDTDSQVLTEGASPVVTQGAVSGSLDLVAQPGVVSANFDYTTSYQVFDQSQNGWVTPATSPNQTWGAGTNTSLPYTMDIPSVPDANKDFTQARIVANIVAHVWNGNTITDTASSATVAVANNGVQIYAGTRQVESNTKVDALSGLANGSIPLSMPLREKGSSSGGTAGLNLQTVSLNDEASASDALARVDAAQASILRQMQYYASVHKAVSVQNDFEGKLVDQLNIGIDNLVDADMAAEDSKLIAAQTRQQLNVADLSISNQFPQLLLSLFRA